MTEYLIVPSITILSTLQARLKKKINQQEVNSMETDGKYKIKFYYYFSINKVLQITDQSMFYPVLNRYYFGMNA
jgi:hypothetical protein